MERFDEFVIVIDVFYIIELLVKFILPSKNGFGEPFDW